MKSQPNSTTLHMNTHKAKESFTWNALFHIKPGRRNPSAHCTNAIAHVGPLPTLNTADLLVLHHKELYVSGLWGKFVFI